VCNRHRGLALREDDKLRYAQLQIAVVKPV
jgi:hypothetical protein